MTEAFNGNIALAQGVAQMSDVTQSAMLDKSVEILTLIGSSAPLSLSWSKQWTLDSRQYYIDSLKVITKASYSAKAAADYAKYQEDIQEGQLEMSGQNNLLQDNKSVLKTLGNAMDQVYSIMQGPVQQEKALNKEILIAGG